MFENYLSHPEIYQALEEHFEKTFNTLLKKENLDQEQFQTPYYRTHFANGMPFMNGNPIFSTKHLSNQDRLRVILDIDASDTTCFENKLNNSKELCICGSVQNIEQFKKAMNNWLKQQKLFLNRSQET